MAHTSEKRWNNINNTVGDLSSSLIDYLNKSEEIYQQLLELWSFAGGTDQAVADLLFQDTDIPATAEQVVMAQDAKAAVTSLHELWQAANNVAVGQEDRMDKLRRMT